MSISRIKDLRKSKLKVVEKYNAQIKQIENDDKYAPGYKQQQINEIKEKRDGEKQEHHTKITELLNKGKKEVQDKLSKAEFEGASEKSLMRKLIMEQRNASLERRLLHQYKDNAKGLYPKMKDEVENKSLNAPAYINAYIQLEANPMKAAQVEELEREYQQNTLNAMQKDYQKDLESYEQQEAEYQQELGDDAFANVMNKYQ
ncbi:hypothetical protein SH601_05510 [Gracilibacillus sp. S3-1-1]|uniref:Uncharacterized protein n=1 Tax=Gracilibacillus pellucidus TaxID=3095368 RepID=A0ACC6M3D5_9BACI|nr:hypothetical protein [Gracilibacillus sp. S3-1-1]MDX8045442.1 hypothetical protein [Gracilibacillus sp. S3-1-1]